MDDVLDFLNPNILQNVCQLIPQPSRDLLPTMPVKDPKARDLPSSARLHLPTPSRGRSFDTEGGLAEAELKRFRWEVEGRGEDGVFLVGS